MRCILSVENISNIITSFAGVLKSFVNGEEYKKSPPTGPPDNLPVLNANDLKSLQLTTYGEDLNDSAYSYEKITLIEDASPVEVTLPKVEDLTNINICGIDGSNQRVERSTFYFILARAAIVEFRYSTTNLKPYFYNKLIDASGVVWVDGNVFSPGIILQTEKLEKKDPLLRKIIGNPGRPFLFKYTPDAIDKSPASQSLGWAVKLQQALELVCLRDIPTNVETVCIKDGPLFSTSVSPLETIEGLNPIFQWNNQVLIACSKRVKDSRLLVEAILGNVALRNHWFANQDITDDTLKQVSTDSILMPRILRPGFRTPLMEAVPRARKSVVEMEKRLMPLTCYYLSKHQPQTYIRIEIPKFMWERDRSRVERAISIVAWQHELGHKAPLVQLAADMRCQLAYEKTILEKQTLSILYKNRLDFPEEY